MAGDTSGNLYFTDNHAIRYIDRMSGIISTIAGKVLFPGSSGNGGSAINALLNYPGGIAVAGNGDLYIADMSNHAVRYVSQRTTKYMTTFAGTLGTSGSTGNGGSITSALLYNPTAIALDPNGNLYIADTGNHVIRVVSSGIISLFAGITLTTSHTSQLMFYYNTSQLILSFLVSSFPLIKKPVNSFNVSSLSTSNHSFSMSGGWVDANNHANGNVGDDGVATSAQLNGPKGIAVDGSGNYVYISDTGNNRVRLVTIGVSTNIISNYAGQSAGAVGPGGDLGAATSAYLTNPYQISLDTSNNLYIADSLNYVVRVVNAGSHIISRVAGTGASCSAPTSAPVVVTGPATNYCFISPQGVVVDNMGMIYMSDTSKYVITRAMNPLPTGQPTSQPTKQPSSRPSRQPTMQPSGDQSPCFFASFFLSFFPFLAKLTPPSSYSHVSPYFSPFWI